jgi:uncharacterized protein DUF4019
MKFKGMVPFLAIVGVSLTSLLFAAAKPEDEAQKSAEHWLSLIDVGSYAESWKTAAEYFRASVRQEQWQHIVDCVGSTVSNGWHRIPKQGHRSILIQEGRVAWTGVSNERYRTT